ncbi:DUF624 domain-containing protein [Brachybacterium sp. YJGR34]|uniref:DUF624 domain-containing protein n=1 Tax=Brachybacterium sp. YJGR34 TaxID=2059911 RepID=UPI000E0B871D|nr:DUF624 domain-containing protein [Brachybacterium sp. YJGR34]
MDRALGALSTGTDLLLRALALQGLWLLGTLAGGIVLGWAPATTAVVDAAARAARGEPIRLVRTARAWRDGFWRSQITLGLPGLFLLLALAAVTSSLLPTAAEIALGVLATLLLVAFLHVPQIDRRYTLRATEVLGASLRLSLAQAPTSLLLVAVIALCAGVVLTVPGLAPFLGVAVPLMAIQHLVGRSLDRNEDLLAERQDPPAAAEAPNVPHPRGGTGPALSRRPRASAL